MTARAGFIIRNAADAGSNLDLAEPDAGDFSLIANLRYGVLRGCNLAISGWNVTVSSGVVVNNGAVLTTGGSVTLDTASQDARFDLIGVDASGVPIKVVGAASPNPVFPDFGDNVVILASVMVRPGITPPTTNDLTDKRVFVPERFVSALDSGTLLGSYNPTTTAEKFSIDHAGKLSWGDTRVYRNGIGGLKVEDGIETIWAHVIADAWVDNSLTVGGVFEAANFQTGYGAPTGTGQPGWLYQNLQDGGIYTWSVGVGWQQMSTVPIPAGMIMPSLLASEPPGWLFLNGQQVDISRAGGLWTAFPQWQVSTSGGTRLQLPDLSGMFLRQGTPGQTGGVGTLTLTTDNLPAHKHMSVSGQTQSAGGHIHTATIGTVAAHDHSTLAGMGEHAHVVTDPGHAHAGADGGAGGAFVAVVWGGRRRIDGPFNDASHPVAVQEVANTVRAFTGIGVVSGGAHGHYTDLRNAHSHGITIDAATATHTHTFNEQLVGASKPIDTSPPFATCNYLIKI